MALDYVSGSPRNQEITEQGYHTSERKFFPFWNVALGNRKHHINMFSRHT